MEDKSLNWMNCIQSLKLYVDNYKTVSSKNALEWLYEAVAKYPNHPPTVINPTEDGIIIEIINGDYCCELLFKNDNSLERTDYYNNKVIEVCWI